MIIIIDLVARSRLKIEIKAPVHSQVEERVIPPLLPKDDVRLKTNFTQPLYIVLLAEAPVVCYYGMVFMLDYWSGLHSWLQQHFTGGSLHLTLLGALGAQAYASGWYSILEPCQ